VHEGTEYWLWLWKAVNFFSVKEVIAEWENNLNASQHPNNKDLNLKAIGPVRNVMFDPRWIPIGSNNGIPICLDLNPENSGATGQLILVDWEDGTVQLIASSFIEFLENGLEKMKHQ
jgi:cell wall assembly regulator SMI1